MCIISMHMLKYAKTNNANICKYTICTNMHRVCTNMQICIFKICINLYASICIIYAGICLRINMPLYANLNMHKYAQNMQKYAVAA